MSKLKTSDDTILLKMVIESVEENKEGINTLYDIVCKGYDGKEPLLARIIVIEKAGTDLHKRISTLEGFQIQLKTEDRKAKWHYFFLLSISILGWLTAIFTNTSAESLFKFFTLLAKY